MQTLIFFITSLVASVVVLKVTASQVKALKSDWLSCMVAVLLAVVVLTTVNRLLPSELTALAASILVLGFVFESTLDTNFLKGTIVAAVVVITQWLVAATFRYFGVATDLLSFIKEIA